LRNKGYILKEGLKFGADFRVYGKGDKPGKSHAKYLLYIVDTKKIDTLDFAAKARIAHSTNKVLLIAIVDSESDISYYETRWKSKD
jgi:tRNA-intron endonuclease